MALLAVADGPYSDVDQTQYLSWFARSCNAIRSLWLYGCSGIVCEPFSIRPYTDQACKSLLHATIEAIRAMSEYNLGCYEDDVLTFS